MKLIKIIKYNSIPNIINSDNICAEEHISIINIQYYFKKFYY